jgi:hypothetical protein
LGRAQALLRRRFRQCAGFGAAVSWGTRVAEGFFCQMGISIPQV